MASKLFTRISCLLIALMLTHSSYGAEIKFSIEERGSTVQQLAQIQNGRVLVKKAGGDPNQDVLFVADKRQLVVIKHSSRDYMVINDKVIEEIGAISDSVSSVVASQKGVLGDLLGTLGVAQEPIEPRAKMIDAKRQLEISGYQCKLYQSFLNQQIDSELCLAENNQLKLSDKDYQTLSHFLVFADHMLNRAGKLIDALGMSLPQMSMDGVKGLPIGMHSAKKALKVRLTSVNSAGGNQANYNVPQGYSRSPVPFTSG